MNQKPGTLVVLALTNFLMGCSMVHPMSEADNTELPSRSGFLTSYDNLELNRTGYTKTAWVYRNPSRKLSLYKIVMLEPVKVALDPSSSATREDRAKLETMAGSLESEFRAALGNSYPVVENPGFGVMKIRAAITDLRPGLTNLRGLMDSTGGGAAGVEMEMLDSQTGQQIVAVVDMQQATRIQDVIHNWALLMRDALDENQGLHRGVDMHGSGMLWRDR